MSGRHENESGPAEARDIAPPEPTAGPGTKSETAARVRLGLVLSLIFSAFAIAGVPLTAYVVYALVIAVPDQSIESVRAIEDFSILGSLLTWALWLLGSFMFVVTLHETLLFVVGKDGQVPEDSALKEHTIPRRAVWEAGR
jgi:hypothetical protein